MVIIDKPGQSQIGPVKQPVSSVRIFLAFALCMSIYIVLDSLLKNEGFVLPIIAILAVGETAYLLSQYQASKKLQAMCEGAWFLVLLSIFLGIYRNSLMHHRVFTYATILYRPYATSYCNLRLALIIGLSTMAIVLPVTCGIVTNDEISDLLAMLYLLLVLSLWAFCSKPGAAIFGFEKDPSNN